MKIGLFGGSFNPTHHGHIHISNLALKKFNLDQIWWIPTEHNPFKEKNIYKNFDTRFKNCLEITKNNPKIRVKKFQNTVYSHKLISVIKARYANNQFLWIMGADNLTNFHKWEHFREIIKTIKIAVFNRNNHLLNYRQSKTFHIYKNLLRSKKQLKKTLPKISIIRSKNCDISSTKIRNSELISC